LAARLGAAFAPILYLPKPDREGGKVENSRGKPRLWMVVLWDRMLNDPSDR